MVISNIVMDVLINLNKLITHEEAKGLSRISITLL